MIKTIEVGFPGGKRVDAIIDDRLIQWVTMSCEKDLEAKRYKKISLNLGKKGTQPF